MRLTQILFSLCLSLCLLFACKQKTPVEPDNTQPQLPQWAMFGKNLRNTSNAADPVEYYAGPQQGEIVWSWQTNEVFFASPSIGSDGTIYIASSLCDCIHADSGFVYAFNPDGTIKWRFKTQNSNFGTGAVGKDGTYFYGSLDGNLYAIESEGNLRWKRKLARAAFEAEFSRPAITFRGEVVVAADSGVVALSMETGKSIWTYPAATRGGFGVAVNRDECIYIGTMNSLLALNPNGSLKWDFPLKYGPGDIVIGHNGTIYFNVVNDSLLYALNPDGSLKWTYNLGDRAASNRPGIGHDGSIYTINANFRPRLHNVSPMGELAWSIELASLSGIDTTASIDVGNSVPLIDEEGNIYVTMSRTFGDNFFSINQEGQLNWSVHITVKTLFSKPAFSPDGIAYIAGGGALSAIR